MSAAEEEVKRSTDSASLGMLRAPQTPEGGLLGLAHEAALPPLESHLPSPPCPSPCVHVPVFLWLAGSEKESRAGSHIEENCFILLPPKGLLNRLWDRELRWHPQG